MKTETILFFLFLSTGLFALTDKDILLDYAKDNREIKDYDLVENEKSEVYFLRGVDKNGESVFLFISSAQDEVRGYAGNNKVILILDSVKTIKKAVLVKSEDTNSFVKRLNKSKFFAQFKAWNGEDTIEATTGATITSNSVKTTISNLLKRIEQTNLSPN